MRVIRKIGEEVKEVNYPHIDIANPVAGLDGGIVYYYIDKLERPEIDFNKSYLKPTEVLTDKIHPEYSHLLVCERGYEVVDYPNETIIEKLNTAVGEWIESRMPLWKQSKYLGRYIGLKDLNKEGLLDQDRINEMNYYLSLWEWADKCRSDRDLREHEYINNDVFPSFVFDEMPPKNY